MRTSRHFGFVPKISKGCAADIGSSLVIEVNRLASIDSDGASEATAFLAELRLRFGNLRVRIGIRREAMTTRLRRAKKRPGLQVGTEANDDCQASFEGRDY